MKVKDKKSNPKIKLTARVLVLWMLLFAMIVLVAAVSVLRTTDLNSNERSTAPLLEEKEAVKVTETDTNHKMNAFPVVGLNSMHTAAPLRKQKEAAKATETVLVTKQRATFPKPSALASPDARVLVKPTFGSHRQEKDAVFAFAEGYSLPVYVLFITSLRDTGFDGDIVLSVSSRDKLAANVEDFLRYHSRKGVVVYTVDWQCWKKNGEKIEKRGTSTTNNGFSDCKLNGFYGDADGKPVDDPRMPRPVATARYELYWAWSTMYRPKSRILLIDVRDTVFQQDPFSNLERTPRDDQGVLHLFEENSGPNSAAANIGKSKYNSGWIRAAYGEKALKDVRDRPVICSGSTIGDKVAVETYLRAMVKQFDDTKCKRVGCDQGLHNYLIYSRQLDGASGIADINIYKQGEGVVNNLAALRNSPLRDQGVLEKDVVVNWDKAVSNVAHQFDRDKELKQILKRRVDSMISKLDFETMRNSFLRQSNNTES